MAIQRPIRFCLRNRRAVKLGRWDSQLEGWMWIRTLLNAYSKIRIKANEITSRHWQRQRQSDLHVAVFNIEFYEYIRVSAVKSDQKNNQKLNVYFCFRNAALSSFRLIIEGASIMQGIMLYMGLYYTSSCQLHVLHQIPYRFPKYPETPKLCRNMYTILHKWLMTIYHAPHLTFVLYCQQ